MKGKPITPDEVADLKNAIIPGVVFDAFNELIAAAWNGASATIKQDAVVKRILQLDLGIDRALLFDAKYLDVEESYRSLGWNVVYDKPAFNESYPATFTFTKRGTK